VTVELLKSGAGEWTVGELQSVTDDAERVRLWRHRRQMRLQILYRASSSCDVTRRRYLNNHQIHSIQFTISFIIILVSLLYSMKSQTSIRQKHPTGGSGVEDTLLGLRCNLKTGDITICEMTLSPGLSTTVTVKCCKRSRTFIVINNWQQSHSEQ